MKRPELQRQHHYSMASIIHSKGAIQSCLTGNGERIFSIGVFQVTSHVPLTGASLTGSDEVLESLWDGHGSFRHIFLMPVRRHNPMWRRSPKYRWQSHGIPTPEKIQHLLMFETFFSRVKRGELL